MNDDMTHTFESSSNDPERHDEKLRNTISRCTHASELYYANGMCKNCYHAKGRTKKAHLCKHSDRTLYARGVCKNCYLSLYHKEKRLERRRIKQLLKAEALK
jgi:hypothetical protein